MRQETRYRHTAVAQPEQAALLRQTWAYLQIIIPGGINAIDPQSGNSLMNNHQGVSDAISHNLASGNGGKLAGQLRRHTNTD